VWRVQCGLERLVGCGEKKEVDEVWVCDGLLLTSARERSQTPPTVVAFSHDHIPIPTAHIIFCTLSSTVRLKLGLTELEIKIRICSRH
jgi:hypothetical protein